MKQIKVSSLLLLILIFFSCTQKKKDDISAQKSRKLNIQTIKNEEDIKELRSMSLFQIQEILRRRANANFAGQRELIELEILNKEYCNLEEDLKKSCHIATPLARTVDVSLTCSQMKNKENNNNSSNDLIIVETDIEVELKNPEKRLSTYILSVNDGKFVSSKFTQGRSTITFKKTEKSKKNNISFKDVYKIEIMDTCETCQIPVNLEFDLFIHRETSPLLSLRNNTKKENTANISVDNILKKALSDDCRLNNNYIRDLKEKILAQMQKKAKIAQKQLNDQLEKIINSAQHMPLNDQKEELIDLIISHRKEIQVRNVELENQRDLQLRLVTAILSNREASCMLDSKIKSLRVEIGGSPELPKEIRVQADLNQKKTWISSPGCETLHLKLGQNIFSSVDGLSAVTKIVFDTSNDLKIRDIQYFDLRKMGRCFQHTPVIVSKFAQDKTHWDIVETHIYTLQNFAIFVNEQKIFEKNHLYRLGGNSDESSACDENCVFQISKKEIRENSQYIAMLLSNSCNSD